MVNFHDDPLPKPEFEAHTADVRSTVCQVGVWDGSDATTRLHVVCLHQQAMVLHKAQNMGMRALLDVRLVKVLSSSTCIFHTVFQRRLGQSLKPVGSSHLTESLNRDLSQH